MSKEVVKAPLTVRSLEASGNQSSGIDKWIRSVEGLKSGAKDSTVIYRTPMPDVESLMQPWPEAMEELLGDIVCLR
jgi:intraflagellar transport protein 46